MSHSRIRMRASSAAVLIIPSEECGGSLARMMQASSKQRTTSRIRARSWCRLSRCRSNWRVVRISTGACSSYSVTPESTRDVNDAQHNIPRKSAIALCHPANTDDSFTKCTQKRTQSARQRWHAPNLWFIYAFINSSIPTSGSNTGNQLSWTSIWLPV